MKTKATLIPEYHIMKDERGIAYAVFKNERDAYDFDMQFPHYFDTCYLACYNGHCNAFELGVLH